MNHKVVLVTGASRGIGAATITKFAKEGFDVVINYIDSKKEATLKLMDNLEFDNELDANNLKNLVEKEYGVKALLVEADVSNEAEVKNMIKTVIDNFGRLDVVINSAGIVFDRNLYDATTTEFENTLKVDIMGPFLVSREASKVMKNGSIINVSSTNATKCIAPDSIDYNIAKSGLIVLARDLAYALKPNIRVNAIAIGWADTDMNKDLPKDYIEEENEKIYVGRFASPSEIANTLYFLASDEASYITAQGIVIDGGSTLPETMTMGV